MTTFFSLAAGHASLHHVPFDTGSSVLNGLLERGRVGTGRVLHLCGGSQRGQDLVLLSLCHGAIGRGESCVYLDIEGTLSPERIEGAGLMWAFNGSDPDAPFRVLSPQTPKALDEQLQSTLTLLSPTPAMIVVTGLQRALESRFGGVGMRGEALAKAGRALHTLLQKQRLLCARTGTTMVFAHSPQKAKGDWPTPLEKTLRNTMFAHCGFGIELGPELHEDENRSDFFRLPVQAWRYNTKCGASETLELWQEGGFKNP